MQLDNQLKKLLRELGQSINDTIAESDRIHGAIVNLREAGYDVMLKLDATIGLAKRDMQPSRITRQDQNFLESLNIRVDEEATEENAEQKKVEVTAQDIRFLKSLKISLDDQF